MYADCKDYLRESLSHDLLDDSPTRPSWPPFPPYANVNRPPTPPPEMNAASYPSKRTQYGQDHEYQYGNSAYDQQRSRAPTTSHVPKEVSNVDFGRSAALADPCPQSRQPVLEDAALSSQQRRASQASSIAPSFQIPKAVNDSGGSLAELAAQITCLFWFESSDLLKQIEDCVIPLQPPRPLVSDAKPTTGFRKWVTTILSTTMVAQNVVILALLFVYRLKKLNPSVQGKPGSEYRLLTVALMLGNKFLDDNTYTNRTWAEVSGINVTEVHIMEVEFLSNMKYCLFTTADDWTQWQALLGKFAAFFERATKPQPIMPIFPPTSSLNLPMALPSPPASNQASPPYLADLGTNGTAYPQVGLAGPSPAPSPHVFLSNEAITRQSPRKRTYDDQSVEPPAKRLARAYPDYQAPHQYTTPQSTQLQYMPRLPLPNTSLPASQNSSAAYAPSNRQLHQLLPPINVPSRAMSMVYPSSSAPASLPQIHALAGSSLPPSQHQSRQQSPYPASNNGSPTSAFPPSSGVSLPPPVQVSPTYYLQHRNSPYRPVQNVSTLLHPPPSTALHRRPQNIETDQMCYAPLGKPQQRQSGRLPYVMQNVWLDGNLPEIMTPVQQWPSFINTQQQQQLISQQ